MITWKFVSPLTNNGQIDALEVKYCFPLPEDLKECIKRNNGGTPSVFRFDTTVRKGMVFGGLLSFNQGDDDSVYSVLPHFESADKKHLTAFPFGLDPFGNYYVIQENKIYFIDHETDRRLFISNSFSELLEMLS